ncbi:Oidioi.mRNA.OKI2018_I69.chr2.g5482.t1.cds [Oikopleura dioica]|uniref:Oidioi.mRNA.OKI2018_I69.chr2.g5482.t1.cds n=1 Tax=Oikopleura dioica TaxID=34765 RepID=A0ABN7T641_OIKDI|nr:Oidioi.mRNA.OKI2018_I69.chr2.g5482.t1.cds [Oikopleura dioica]
MTFEKTISLSRLRSQFKRTPCDFPAAKTGFASDIRPSDIDVFHAAAKRFASMHIISEEESQRPIKTCYHAWPWNTKAIRSHYKTATYPEKLIKIYVQWGTISTPTTEEFSSLRRHIDRGKTAAG